MMCYLLRNKPELKLDLEITVTDVFIGFETALPVSNSPKLYILFSFLERKAVPSYCFILKLDQLR